MIKKNIPKVPQMTFCFAGEIMTGDAAASIRHGFLIYKMFFLIKYLS
jgi:hypothetical protein